MRGHAVLAAIGCVSTCALGCDKVFGLERTDGPPPCTFGTFGMAEDLPYFTGAHGREFDPFETVDRLEIWFTRSDATPSKIIRATRTRVDADYGGETPVLASATGVADPVLTPDGEHLVYTDTGAAYESIRTGGTFVPGTKLVLPNNVSGLDISPDGLILYVAIGGRLLQAHRDSLASEFHANPPDLGLPGTIKFPSVYVSGDAMEVFYSVDEPPTSSSVHRSYRADPTSPFQDEMIIKLEGPTTDPMISRDGLRLTVAGGETLSQLTRTCNP